MITCVATGGQANVRINEFSTGVTGAATNEFVEIVNSGSASADLSGWKLVYRSATGTSDTALDTIPDGTSLAPGAFYLFGGGGYTGPPAADESFSQGLAAAAGGLALRDANGAIVDSVGYGSTAANGFVEGSPASAPPATAAPGSSDVASPTVTTPTATPWTSPSPRRRRRVRRTAVARSANPQLHPLERELWRSPGPCQSSRATAWCSSSTSSVWRGS